MVPNSSSFRTWMRAMTLTLLVACAAAADNSSRRHILNTKLKPATFEDINWAKAVGNTAFELAYATTYYGTGTEGASQTLKQFDSMVRTRKIYRAWAIGVWSCKPCHCATSLPSAFSALSDFHLSDFQHWLPQVKWLLDSKGTMTHRAHELHNYSIRSVIYEVVQLAQRPFNEAHALDRLRFIFNKLSQQVRMRARVHTQQDAHGPLFWPAILPFPSPPPPTPPAPPNPTVTMAANINITHI